MTDHLTDDDLTMYALGGSAAPHRALTEAHLDACDTCRERLAGIAQFDRDLAATDTWDVADEHTDPSPELQRLRAFAALVKSEDAAAALLLDSFRSAPAALVWKNLGNKRKYQTGGVVRLLTALAQEACEREPLHALNYADTATEISRRLADDVYPRFAVGELRGGAWKARANALRYLGNLNAALDALKQADREYRSLPQGGIGLAAVKYVRATVLRERDDFDEALREAHESAEAFVHFGQTDRYFAAHNVKGHVFFSTQRFVEARAVFVDILAYGESIEDASWIGRASLNLGNTDLELGDHPSALAAFGRALTAFRAADLPTEASRAEWGLALIFQRDGSHHQALRHLRAVRAVLLQHGMSNDVSLVTLDIINSLITTGDTKEVPALSASLVENFLSNAELTSIIDGECQRLERALDVYLRDCYRRETSARVSELATYLRVTRPYLSRAIREIAGNSATAFLQTKQVAHARGLLATSTLSIEKIALASGFGTPRTFYRRFEEVMGMTPGQYRDEVTK